MGKFRNRTEFSSWFMIDLFLSHFSFLLSQNVSFELSSVRPILETSPSSSLTVEEGEPALLSCALTSGSADHLYWRRANTKVSQVLKLKSPKILLDEWQLSLSGTLLLLVQCVARGCWEVRLLFVLKSNWCKQFQVRVCGSAGGRGGGDHLRRPQGHLCSCHRAGGSLCQEKGWGQRGETNQK